ncbi:MAG TPA: FkbM family methyltransferase [Rudaea sp.]|nr:FkbM family methyltransferase [Rudaea sp.]
MVGHKRGFIEVDSIFGRIEAFEDDLVTDQIVAFGAHTRPELAFLLSFVDAGDSLFDLGAHIGSFAIPLAQKIGPGGRIVVVEGLPETFVVLERNMRRLVPHGASVLVNALIASAGQRYAAQTPQGNTGANFFAPAAGGEGIAVPATTLDALCHAHFFPRVVKMDLEGFEAFALEGGRELLARRPIIYAEIADQLLRRCGASVAQLDTLLQDHGYRYFRNVGDRNAAHDNYLVAELPTLAAGGDFFDVLAIHRDDERLQRVFVTSTAKVDAS